MLATGLIWLLGEMLGHAEDKKVDVPTAGTIYSPIGKRDPFRPQGVTDSGDREVSNLSGLEKFSIEQFQLRGILRGAGKPHAMFEDPEARTYILTEGDVIGRERATISRIVNSEVILTQRTFNYLGAESLLEKVMSLPKADDINADGVPQKGGGRRPAKDAGKDAGASAGNPLQRAASSLMPAAAQEALKQAVAQPTEDEVYKKATGEALPADLGGKTP